MWKETTMTSNADKRTHINQVKIHRLVSRILSLENQNLNTKKLTSGDVVNRIFNIIKVEVDKDDI